ncbi:MAG: hypothetical protein RIR70_252 [Pseudomonadota bacterium]|jgi:hypothetical protein
MRTYPRNSPEAAARILALFLIADGHLCCSEANALQQLDATRELGLTEEDFQHIVQTLCEDQFLGTSLHRAAHPRLDEATIASLLAEVDDPKLQGKVLYLAIAASVADRHLAEGEIDLLKIAFKYWPNAGATRPANLMN